MVSSSQILPEWCKSGPRGAAALPADSPIVGREQQKDNVEIVGQNQRPAFGWSSRFGDHTEVLLPVAYLGFSMLRATMSHELPHLLLGYMLQEMWILNKHTECRSELGHFHPFSAV